MATVGVLNLPIETVLKYSSDKAQAIAAIEHVLSHPDTDFSAEQFVHDEDSRYHAANVKREFADEFLGTPDKKPEDFRKESNQAVISSLHEIAQLSANRKNRLGQLIQQSPEAGRSRAPVPTQQTKTTAQAFVREYVTKSAQTFQQQNAIKPEAIEARRQTMPIPRPAPVRTERLIETPQPRLSRAEREHNEFIQDIYANIAFTMAAIIMCRRANRGDISLFMVADFNIGGLEARLVAFAEVTGTQLSRSDLEQEHTREQEDSFLQQHSNSISKLMDKIGMFRQQPPARPCAQEAAADLPAARSLQQFMLRSF